MKKFLILITALFLLIFTYLFANALTVGWQKPVLGSIINPAHDLAQNLQVYYPILCGAGFNIYDYSPFKRPGLFQDRAISPWIPSRLGWALDFDGNNDNIRVPGSGINDAMQDTGQFTIAVWVRLTVTNTLAVISERWHNAGSCSQFIFRYDGAADHTIEFYLQDGAGTQLARSNGALLANRWYHVVGVVDGSKLMVYLDGVLQATTTDTYDGTINSCSGDIAIAEDDGFDNTSIMAGQIADYSIRNIGLNATQVMNLYRKSWSMFAKPSRARFMYPNPGAPAPSAAPKIPPQIIQWQNDQRYAEIVK